MVLPCVGFADFLLISRISCLRIMELELGCLSISWRSPRFPIDVLDCIDQKLAYRNIYISVNIDSECNVLLLMYTTKLFVNFISLNMYIKSEIYTLLKHFNNYRTLLNKDKLSTLNKHKQLYFYEINIHIQL